MCSIMSPEKFELTPQFVWRAPPIRIDVAPNMFVFWSYVFEVKTRFGIEA